MSSTAATTVPGSADIESLGPLFKITRVYLWDEDDGIASTDSAQPPPTAITNPWSAADVNLSTNNTVYGQMSVEDFELAQEMDSLGLPMSFGNTKERKNMCTKVKKKGVHAKSVSADNVCGMKVCQCEDIASSDVSHDITHVLASGDAAEGDSEANRHSASGECSRDSLASYEESVVHADILGEDDMKQVSDEITEVLMDSLVGLEHIPDDTDMERSLDRSLITFGGCCSQKVSEDARYGLQSAGEFISIQAQDHSEDSSSTTLHIGGATNDNSTIPCFSTTELSLSNAEVDHVIPDCPDNSVVYKFGEWRVVWDSFYKRNYFYNVQTQESTWHPPSGLEHFTYYCKINNSSTICADVDGVNACLGNQNVYEYLNQSLEEISCEPSSGRTVNYEYEHSGEHATPSKTADDQTPSELSDINDRTTETTLQGAVTGLPENIVKYWCQRFSLFSRFGYGVRMDEEGWFSVTPESIARHHASRLACGTVIDCFAGVGGNAIQFALKCNHVIAVDIDQHKVDCGRHNAAIYGVNDQIDFLIGDFFQIAAHLKADIVFLSPPWGGPDYNKVQTYDITMLKPRDGHDLFNVARMIAPKVVMFLPKNVNLNQLAELAGSVTPPWALEVEKNFLNGKLKAITAYFDRPTE